MTGTTTTGRFEAMLYGLGEVVFLDRADRAHGDVVEPDAHGNAWVRARVRLFTRSGSGYALSFEDSAGTLWVPAANVRSFTRIYGVRPDPVCPDCGHPVAITAYWDAAAGCCTVCRVLRLRPQREVG